MLIQTTQNKRRTIWFGMTIILAGGALVLHAFNPQPDPPKVFGIFGIAVADAIRLNVTNVAPDLGVFPPPCRARIGFVNAAGELLKSTDVSLPNGHSAFLTLNFFEASAAADTIAPRTRANIRPVIAYLAPDPCFTAVSAEVLDATTGRVSIHATPQSWIPAGTTAPGPQ